MESRPQHQKCGRWNSGLFPPTEIFVVAIGFSRTPNAHLLPPAYQRIIFDLCGCSLDPLTPPPHSVKHSKALSHGCGHICETCSSRIFCVVFFHSFNERCNWVKWAFSFAHATLPTSSLQLPLPQRVLCSTVPS
jgi:hypothetical protein